MSTMDETKTEVTAEPSTSATGLYRRTKLGRRARNRRRKYLELEAAANAAALGGGSESQAKDTAGIGKSSSDLVNPASSSHADLLPTASKKTRASSTTNSTEPSSIPTDRSYEQARVREISTLTEDDRQMLTRQLGYLPGNALKVVARMRDAFGDVDGKASTTLDSSIMMNEPLVVKLYPLVLRDEADGTKSKRRRKRQDENANEPLLEPFPTTYWVTHPRIKALVSKLELDRMGSECEKILKKDLEDERGIDRNEGKAPKQPDDPPSAVDATISSQSALSSMKRAHLAYGKERKELILPQDWEYIENRKWERAFDPSTRGVAGIRNQASVKCLHAHVAHFWSGCPDNVVGKWVAERVAQALEEAGTTSCSVLST